MTRTTMRWTWAAMAAALAACGGDAPATEEDGAGDGLAAAGPLLAASPCDGEGPSVMFDSTVAGALTGGKRLHPEVGDCQRLVGADGEFGPLVGLYPVDATLRLAAADFATARPAVALYSWGAAGGPYADAYPELGLAQAGPSCLWVRSAAEGAWSGALVHGAYCGGGAAPPADAAFTLPVFARTVSGAAAADYPRTARWEWDLDGRRHAIGFKCGDAWCEAVGSGAAPRTQPLEGGDDTPRERVPGWSDAQHLAVFDSAAGKARPGPWASLVAYRGIAGEAPAWIEGLLAARITVYGPAGAFGERFYLQPESGSGHDDVILRFPGMQDEAWLQQGPMRRRQATRIQFMPTPEHAQVGTVRWRWSEGGETIWSYCPSASCWVVP